MSWLSRKQKCRSAEMQRNLFCISALLLAVFSLSACGFEPIHAQRPNAIGEKIESVAVDSVTATETSGSDTNTAHRRLAQLFQSTLEDRLNPGNKAQPARYHVNVA